MTNLFKKLTTGVLTLSILVTPISAFANVVNNNTDNSAKISINEIKNLKSDKIKIATVYSQGNPQDGQDNRSSGNFSTDFNFNGYSKLYWEITEINNPNNVSFKVMRDKSAAKDPVIFSDLRNGSITDVEKYRSLYIANPSGTCGASFLVTVYAFN